MKTFISLTIIKFFRFEIRFGAGADEARPDVTTVSSFQQTADQAPISASHLLIPALPTVPSCSSPTLQKPHPPQ